MKNEIMLKDIYFNFKAFNINSLVGSLMKVRNGFLIVVDVTNFEMIELLRYIAVKNTRD